METENRRAGNIGETAAEKEPEVGNIKNVVANKLHNVAQTIARKTAAADVKPGVAYYGEQASVMLDQAADYVEELDYDKVKASASEYVKQNPGRSLLIAAITGLVIGGILKRR